MLKNKSSLLIAGVAVFAVGAAFTTGFSLGQEKAAKNTRIYELRTYTTHEGRMPAMHARFRDHTMKLFEKHGMKNVMYWTPTDEKLSQNTLIYVISHESLEAAKKSWDGFLSDPDWKKVAAESEKDGKIVAKVDKVYLRATDYSPLP